MHLLDALVRYGIAKETSLIFGVGGVILAIVGLLVGLLGKRQDQFKKPLIIFCVAVLLGSALLLWNYYTTFYIERNEAVRVPNVLGLSYEKAQFAIRLLGLREVQISENGEVISGEEEVQAQDPEFPAEVLVGSEVKLRVGKKRDPVSYVPDASPSPPKEDLTITIDYVQETEAYHYEYPDPQNPETTLLIDLGKGMSGTFSYSRSLTAEEETNWYHGGKLYDENGNEVGQEGNWPTFWSNPDGKFAFAFPQNLPAGQYTYELYQYISGRAVSDTVEFVVR